MVANTLLGAAFAVLLAIAIVAEPPSPIAPWVVAFLLALGWATVMPYGFWRTNLHRAPRDGRRAVAEVVDGRPALALYWAREHLVIPVVATTYLFVATVAFGLGAHVSEGIQAAWLGYGLAIVIGSLLPDAYARLGRRHCLVLDARGVTARGWDGDAFLAWDDIDDGVYKRTGQWYSIRFVGRPDASSYTWRRRRPRFLLVFKPRSAYVEAPVAALDVGAVPLRHTVMYYVRNPTERYELTDGTARRRVLDEIPTPPPLPRGS